MDVARTLVLPDLPFPSRGMLATLALFWESIELPLYAGIGGEPDRSREIVDALAGEGIIHVHELTQGEDDEEAYATEANEVAAAWASTAPGATAATVDTPTAEAIVSARARRIARLLRSRVDAGLGLARDLWAAPVAASPLGFLASALPKQEIDLPVSEGTLIHLAVGATLIDPATPTDRLLRFREQHKALAGHLRGSLIDLAANIRPDLPMPAVLGQAEATLKNRVEPALSALETELKRARISYVWTNVMGAGGILAVGADPITATIGGGAHIVARGIRYAFNRDALVRDHPFGYLYKVRTSFLGDGAGALDGPYMRNTASKPDLESVITKVCIAGFLSGKREDYALAVIGPRCTEPNVCREYLRTSFRRPSNPWIEAILTATRSE